METQLPESAPGTGESIEEHLLRPNRKDGADGFENAR